MDNNSNLLNIHPELWIHVSRVVIVLKINHQLRPFEVRGSQEDKEKGNKSTILHSQTFKHDPSSIKKDKQMLITMHLHLVLNKYKQIFTMCRWSHKTLQCTQKTCTPTLEH